MCLTARLDRDQHASRRKKEDAFYTPAFITRYIVGQALGTVLADRFEALRGQHEAQAGRTTRRALANSRAYDHDTLTDSQRKALIRFWEAWQDDGLARIRIVDPSCGSGAFLIEAFEQLYQAYERSNDRLEELRGNRTLFDLDRQILQHNLYGGIDSQTFNTLLGSFYNPAFEAANGGTAASAEMALAAGLATGEVYFIIHTTTHPAGEIHGFLNLAAAPEPASLPMLGMGIGGLTVIDWARHCCRS